MRSIKGALAGRPYSSSTTSFSSNPLKNISLTFLALSLQYRKLYSFCKAYLYISSNAFLSPSSPETSSKKVCKSMKFLNLKTYNSVAFTRIIGDKAVNFWVAHMVLMQLCLPRVYNECNNFELQQQAGLSARSSITTSI